MKRVLAITALLVICCNDKPEEPTGIWKIDKVITSSGFKADSLAFLGETFEFQKNGIVNHNNPNSPLPEFRKQTGKWEIIEDTLYQYNEGEKKVPYVIKELSSENMIVISKTSEGETTIYYKRINKK